MPSILAVSSFRELCLLGCVRSLDRAAVPPTRKDHSMPPLPTPADSAAVSDMGHPRRWAIFAVVVLGAFMAQLDLFIVNIAFPAIARDFPGVSASALSW